MEHQQSERFFVSYAVRGPIQNPNLGLRADIPVDHPISGPVPEPSPINTRWKYNPSLIQPVSYKLSN